MRHAILLSMVLLAGCATGGDGVITCVPGADCDAKWSRAMQWLQQNSSWKVQTSTDTQLLTEGPLDTAKPAFEVTKAARDDGRFEISMRAWCGAEGCEPLLPQLQASFRKFVTP
jgi:hypothetical protein